VEGVGGIGEERKYCAMEVLREAMFSRHQVRQVGALRGSVFSAASLDKNLLGMVV
jgi:hypothetical protein